ncbi:hypothetical protein [Ornithinicoccus halotolerans]|uniref:hypothetical protein n=1 Tax=Ornithinicoccus halotolerans TaxID=1748220 RepID=UPI0012949298|nr:hypothetical protein [Ornithinicoccus halotolerans]
MGTDGEPSEDLQRLLRWEEFGGTWQVRARRDGAVAVALCRCDGGEEVERLWLRAPDALRHLAGD